MQALRKRHETKRKLHAKPPRLSSPQAHLGDTWPWPWVTLFTFRARRITIVKARTSLDFDRRKRLARADAFHVRLLLVSSRLHKADSTWRQNLQTSEVSRAAGINRPTLGVIPHMGCRSHADAKSGECANRVGPWTDRTDDADEIRHTYVYAIHLL